MGDDMNINKKIEKEHVDKILRESYLHQPTSLPGEEWYHSVMNIVRQEQYSVEAVCLRAMEIVALRAGWVTAIAAAIIAIASFVTMPSQDRLAWDMYKGGAVSTWIIKSGEL